MNADPFLRRLERTAIVACVVMAVIAFALSAGRPEPAVAVLAGGLLAAVSYWTIGSGVAALARVALPPESVTTDAAPSSPRRPASSWILMKVFARYALLALLAYVMIARLRLHPFGVLAGASSVVAAASVEAFRLLVKKS